MIPDCIKQITQEDIGTLKASPVMIAITQYYRDLCDATFSQFQARVIRGEVIDAVEQNNIHTMFHTINQFLNIDYATILELYGDKDDDTPKDI